MKKTLKKLQAQFAALLMCGSPLLEFPDGSFRLDLSAWAAEETEHTEHSYDNGFSTSCQALQPAEQNAEATYEIGNAGQLFWFAALVNGTLTDGTEQNTAGAFWHFAPPSSGRNVKREAGANPARSRHCDKGVPRPGALGTGHWSICSGKAAEGGDLSVRKPAGCWYGSVCSKSRGIGCTKKP